MTQARVLFIVLILAASAQAQSGWHSSPVQHAQCYGGQCWGQPQWMPPGHIIIRSPVGVQPAQPRQPYTPPVGSPGTPQFEPTRPIEPPQLEQEDPEKPAQPPEPTIDQQAWDDWQKAQEEKIDKRISGEVSLLIQQIADSKCQCGEHKPCECGDTLVQIQNRLTNIENTLTAPTPQPTSKQHVVVVADRNAPYWQRLADEIAKTQQTYHGVQTAGLPEFAIGQTPQAVVYENGVPVRVVKGESKVIDLLSRARRGMSI